MDTLPSTLRQTFKVLQYNPRPPQIEIHKALCSSRFVVAATHRRMGKSVAAAVQCFYWCLSAKDPHAQVAFLAPTREQARRVIWGYLTRFADHIPGVIVRSGELALIFPNGSKLMLLGSDRADALRGMYLNAAVVDEAAYSRAYAWHSVLRPALSDKQGPCLFTSTPNGHDDLFWRLYEYAGSDKATGWARLQFSVEETNIIPRAELEEARASMTENAYRREFLVDFSMAPEFSVYGDVVSRLFERRPFTDKPVPHDAELSVFAGISQTDAVALWLVWYKEDEIHFVEYWFDQTLAFQKALDVLRKWRKQYRIGEIILPEQITQSPFQGSRIEALEEIAPLAPVKEPPLMDGVERVREALMVEGVFIHPGASKGFDDLIQLCFSHDSNSGELRDRFAPCRFDMTDLALRLGFSVPPQQDDVDTFELDYSWVI